MKALGDFVFRILLLAYPPAFRRRYRADLIAFFREDRVRPRDPGGLRGWLQFWVKTTRDSMRAASSLRADKRRRTHPVSGPSLTAWLGSIGGDLRAAARSLASTPATTVVALLVLTVGLGASTTIFAVVDAIALRPLPYADPDRLVAVSEVDLKTGRPGTAAAPNYLEWLARQDVFSEIGASNYVFLTLMEGDRSERIRSVRTTASLFPMLSIVPQLGRLFNGGDEAPGAGDVVLISDAYWRSRFGGSPSAVGTTLQFEDRARRIVGVLPVGFTYPIVAASLSDVRFWVPLAFTDRDRERGGGRSYSLSVVARLRPDVSLDRARQRMTQIRDALAPQYPRWFDDHGVTVRWLRDSVISASVRSWTMLLLGAVALVLLIACVNVANLLLARGSGRAREFQIRAALGATRADLVRGVALESLVLAALGVAGAWLVAEGGVAVLRATLPDTLPRLSAIALDGRVFTIAALTGVATSLLVGIAPAVALTRPRVALTLRESGRANTASRGQQRVRSVLVVVEVALAIVLLVGAGLFVASFLRVATRDLGFDQNRVATMSVAPRRGADSLGRPPEATDADDRVTLAAVLARVQRTPGVESAAFMNGGLPLTGSSRTNTVTVSWRAEPFTGDDEAFICETTAGYRDVIGLRLRRGRWLADSDRGNTPYVVVISETAAARYFGDSEPIGAEITVDEKKRTVVGVVGDTLFRGPEGQRVPQVYIPLPQSTALGTSLAVRLQTSDARLIAAVKDAAWSAAPSAVVSNVRTLDDLFTTLLAQRRFNMLLIGTFGSIALLLVFAGIYGVMAHAVAQRVTEIGVRMALGARPAQMLAMVLSRAAWLGIIGLTIGWLGAAALEQFVRAFLFQPEPRDPSVYLSVGAALLMTTMVAAAVPARRAARVDPLVSLRAE